MSEMSSSSMRMTPKRGYLGICTVIGLILLTIYMAFAFPFTIFQSKQKETTEIKSVIIVSRSGEKSPTPESYFIGEEPPEELYSVGYEQLTNVGKERMYLLGKFLKLRYYHLLLNGNPRMLNVRSADLDRSLESAQALLAGLNPPKDGWLWSFGAEHLQDWQPKAIHTTSAASDDLLSINPNCYNLNQGKTAWKNSTKYLQLINEFRHDLQTLRANTGLEFEDDLEMLSQIEDSLKTRLAFKGDVPAWYTPTFANRLSHIADVTTGSRFSSAGTQRLFVGRLLDEIVNNINSRIRLEQELLAAAECKGQDEPAKDDNSKQQAQQQASKPLSSAHCILEKPKVSIYMTDRQRLAALLNSLQIYSSQPQFGSTLLIELHYDPINGAYFLRLFTISSTSPNVFPEPLRVNPIACADSSECSSQQFEQNIRHLMLKRAGWQDACNTVPPIQPSSSTTTTTTTIDPLRLSSWQPEISGDANLNEDDQRTPSQQDKAMPASTTATSSPVLNDAASTTAEDSATTSSIEKLDESLIVGPTNVQTEPSTIMTLSPDNLATIPGMVHDSATTTPTMSVPDSADTKKENTSVANDQKLDLPSSSKEVAEPVESNATSEHRAKFIIDPRNENSLAIN